MGGGNDVISRDIPYTVQRTPICKQKTYVSKSENVKLGIHLSVSTGRAAPSQLGR